MRQPRALQLTPSGVVRRLDQVIAGLLDEGRRFVMQGAARSVSQSGEAPSLTRPLLLQLLDTCSDGD